VKKIILKLGQRSNLVWMVETFIDSSYLEPGFEILCLEEKFLMSNLKDQVDLLFLWHEELQCQLMGRKSQYLQKYPY